MKHLQFRSFHLGIGILQAMPTPHPPALARGQVGGGGPFVNLTRATIALAFYRPHPLADCQ